MKLVKVEENAIFEATFKVHTQQRMTNIYASKFRDSTNLMKRKKIYKKKK